MQINVRSNVGTVEYIIRHSTRDNTHIQHIAIFLEVRSETLNLCIRNISDDTSGAIWIDIDRINEENSSPLVLSAKEYLENNKLERISYRFDDWKIRKDKVWRL